MTAIGRVTRHCPQGIDSRFTCHSFELWHRAPLETRVSRVSLSHLRKTLVREFLLYRGRPLSTSPGSGLCVTR